MLSSRNAIGSHGPFRIAAAGTALILAACAASGPKFERVDAPKDKVSVYVYRVGSIVGGAAEYGLVLNKKFVTTIGNGGYYQASLEPGAMTCEYMYGISNPFIIARQIQKALNGLSSDLSQCGKFSFDVGSEHFLKVKMHMVGMDLIEVPRDKALDELRGLGRFEDSKPTESQAGDRQ